MFGNIIALKYHGTRIVYNGYGTENIRINCIQNGRIQKYIHNTLIILIRQSQLQLDK